MKYGISFTNSFSQSNTLAYLFLLSIPNNANINVMLQKMLAGCGNQKHRIHWFRVRACSQPLVNQFFVGDTSEEPTAH